MAISKGQKNDGTKEEKVSLEEKIESLVEWRKKYPRATIVPGVSRDVFESYAKTEEKQNQLFEEYEKMREYYKYITRRKWQGKLNEEQIERCREGKVGGVFGRDTKTAELIKKYDLRECDVNFITGQYGDMDDFRKSHIDAVINHDFEHRLGYYWIKNLIMEFDLNSPDWVSRKSNRLEDIIYDLPGRRNTFVKREELEKKVIETIKEKGYSDEEQEVLFMWYGINGMEKADEKQIAEKTGKYLPRIHRVIEKSMKEFKTFEFLEQLDSENITLDIDVDLQKGIIEEYFKNFDIFVPREPVSMDEDVKEKLDTMLLDGVEETKKRKEVVNNQIAIAESMIKGPTNSELIEPGKEEEIEEFIENNEYIIGEKKDMLKKLLAKRVADAKRLAIVSDKDELRLKTLETPIEELDLSVRTFNCLKRAQINTIMDLVGRSGDEVSMIRNLGKFGYNEVISKLQPLAIEMVDGHLNFASANSPKNNGVPGEDEKETLVKHILEQQDTIGEQQAEINELSSQNKEEVNE